MQTGYLVKLAIWLVLVWSRLGSYINIIQVFIYMVNRLYGQFVRTICLICTVRPPCYLLPQLEVLLEALHGHLHHGAPVILEGLQGRLPRVLPGVHVAVWYLL